MKLTDELQEAAKAAAERMIETGDISRPIELPGLSNTLSVSTDQSSLVSIGVFSLHGKHFYIGLTRKP